LPLGRRIRPPSRPSTAGQQNDGGRTANRRRPASQNGYGRPAERLRPAGRTAAAIQRSGCGRSATAGRQVDGHHPTEWRRPPFCRVAAAAVLQSGGGHPEELAVLHCTGRSTGRRPPARRGHRRPGNGRQSPPPLCLTAAVGKAVCGRGHCGHRRHCMLGHYVRHGRLRRPPGPTERPVSAADRDAPCAARQGRVGPAGRPHPPAGGGGGCCSRVALLFSKNQYRSWAGEAWLTVMYSMRIGIFSIQWNTDIKPRFRCLTARTRQAGSIIGQNEKRAVNKTAALPPCFSRANSSRCSVKQGLPLIGQQTD
jgi:hypothetical protein